MTSRKFFLRQSVLLLGAAWIFFTAACATVGKPSYEIQYYLLDYPPPVLKPMPRLDATLRLNRFTIDAAYNTQSMVFRSDKYSLDYFNYNRWAVNPADMVADMLLRDLQASGLFSAVFSRYSIEETNFVVLGSIGAFYLRAEPQLKQAVLDVKITLKDLRKTIVNERVVFQKKYCQEEPLAEYSPRGYCAAMSRAMERLSAQIVEDLYQAIRASRR